MWKKVEGLQPPENVQVRNTTGPQGLDTSLTVTWERPKKNSVVQSSVGSVVVGYWFRVFRRRKGTEEWSLEKQGKEFFEYVTDQLRPYTEYELYVQSYGVKAEGPKSAIATRRTNALPPTTPPVLSLSRVTMSEVMVQWQPPTQPNGLITSYKLFFDRPGLDDYDEIDVPGDRSSFTFEHLLRNHVYRFQVIAANEAGESPESELLSTRTKDLTANFQFRSDKKTQQTSLGPAGGSIGTNDSNGSPQTSIAARARPSFSAVSRPVFKSPPASPKPNRKAEALKSTPWGLRMSDVVVQPVTQAPQAKPKKKMALRSSWARSAEQLQSGGGEKAKGSDEVSDAKADVVATALETVTDTPETNSVSDHPGNLRRALRPPSVASLTSRKYMLGQAFEASEKQEESANTGAQCQGMEQCSPPTGGGIVAHASGGNGSAAGSTTCADADTATAAPPQQRQRPASSEDSRVQWPPAPPPAVVDDYDDRGKGCTLDQLPVGAVRSRTDLFARESSQRSNEGAKPTAVNRPTQPKWWDKPKANRTEDPPATPAEHDEHQAAEETVAQPPTGDQMAHVVKALAPFALPVTDLKTGTGTIRGKKNGVRKNLEIFTSRNELVLSGRLARLYEEEKDGMIVMYTSSVSAVREQYARCDHMKKIFDNLRLKVRVKDIAMHSEYTGELEERLPGAVVPQVFVDGLFFGDLDKVSQLNESGSLKSLLGNREQKPPGDCPGCGGAGYVPCAWCQGSKKSLVHPFREKTATAQALRCTVCNENGLQRCAEC